VTKRILVGLCFLAVTFTFAIDNVLVRSYFSIPVPWD